LSELSEKTTIRVPLFAAIPIIIALISFGGIVDRLLTSEERREELKEYLLEEVEGLRKDWERDRKSQDERLYRLEKLEKHDGED